MKRKLAILLILFVTACSTQRGATFSYSGIFSIKFPQDWIQNSTVMFTDGLAIKTTQGNYLVGQILMAGTDGLPSDFDMRLYPELVLRIKDYTGPSQEFKEKLNNSTKVFNDAYDLSSIDITHSNGATRYSTCRETSCLGFVVKDSYPEHILLVISEGKNKTHFDKIFKGAIHVN